MPISDLQRIDYSDHSEIIVPMKYYLQKIRELANLIDYEVDNVIGITSGGVVAAKFITPLLKQKHNKKIHLAFIPAESYGDGKEAGNLIIGSIATTKKIKGDVLVVDDLTETGNTLKEVVDRLILDLCPEVNQIMTAVVFHKETSKEIPTYYAEKVPMEKNKKCPWIIQPWDIKS